MKRIFAIMAALVLCFALTVPSFAAGSDYPPIPDGDYSLAVVYFSSYSNHYVLNLVYGEYNTEFEDDLMMGYPQALIGEGKQYYCNDSTGSWEFNKEGLLAFSINDDVEVVYSTEDLYHENGTLLFKANVVTENESNHVLIDSVSSASLTGALGEVLGMLVVALPVVAGLIGIRKGVAFLISRIRGV